MNKLQYKKNKESILTEGIDWAQLALSPSDLELFFGPPPGRRSYSNERFVNGVLLYLYTHTPRIYLPTLSGRRIEEVGKIASMVFDRNFGMPCPNDRIRMQDKIEEYFHKKGIIF